MEDTQARFIIGKTMRHWWFSYEELMAAHSERLWYTMRELPVPGVNLIDLIDALEVVKAIQERVR